MTPQPCARLVCLATLIILVGMATAGPLMAVDFGSDFIKVAVVPPGKLPEIVTNEMSKRRTSAQVAVVDGNRLLGEEAAALGVRYPAKVYSRLRDWVGKPAKDASVQALLQGSLLSFSTSADPDRGTLTVKTDTKDSLTSEELVVRPLSLPGSNAMSIPMALHIIAAVTQPQQCVKAILNACQNMLLGSAQQAGMLVCKHPCLLLPPPDTCCWSMQGSMLHYAKGITESYISYAGAGQVLDCVITVPAFFSQSQRAAILDAAKLAGVNVLSLVNNHAAAALQHSITQDFTNRSEHVIFYDIGAGSVEGALIKFSSFDTKQAGKTVTHSQFEVKDVAWDASVGVQHLDILLVHHFADQFEQKHPGSDVRASPRAVAKLMKQVSAAVLCMHACFC